MNSCLNRIPGLLTVLCMTAMLAGAAATAQANNKGHGHQGPPEAMQGHGGEMHGRKHDEGHRHRGGEGEHGHEHGKGHDGTHLFGQNWRKTLTAEQKAELDRLHVEFAKTKAPIMARAHAVKARLAVLATSDQPDAEAINGLIEELLQAKREVMSAKYRYVVAQRSVLTTSQRVSFDMEVIHRAMHGQREKHGHGGKGH